MSQGDVKGHIANSQVPEDHTIKGTVNGEQERSTRYVSKLDQMNASLTLYERRIQQLRLKSDE